MKSSIYFDLVPTILCLSFALYVIPWHGIPRRIAFGIFSATEKTAGRLGRSGLAIISFNIDRLLWARVKVALASALNAPSCGTSCAPCSVLRCRTKDQLPRGQGFRMRSLIIAGRVGGWLVGLHHRRVCALVVAIIRAARSTGA